MPASKKSGGKPPKRPIERYEHRDQKRINNPPVGLVTPETDPVAPTHKTYEYVAPVPSVKPRQELDYDPHLDPQLVWAGKKEHSSFEVPTVSLHVHERIDPHTIMDAVRKRNGAALPVQASLFERREENPPLREAIDFYRHAHGWSNRLIAGDSLLVMNSLLEKEGMAGQVQVVYIDPPYGVKYGSNFQPFVNKREVKDGKDEDLTQEPETVRAFRDTWELGIHSYLGYLRDRLLAARDLLGEKGSVFVQIGDENVHLVRSVLDDVFGRKNFCTIITIAKTAGATSDLMAGIADYLVWYAKDKDQVKYRQLYSSKGDGEGDDEYRYLLMPDGTSRTMTAEERADPKRIPVGAERFRPSATTSQRPPGSDPLTFRGRVFRPGKAQYWKTSIEGLTRLGWANRLIPRGESISYLRKLNDFPVMPLNNVWMDTRWGFDAQDKRYVVETNTKVLTRALLMTTDPGDLVLDPTCGSGTTAFVAEQWGRRWITCDTSRVAVTLAKQRLMATSFDYYELAHPDEGVGSGFNYKTVPHVTLKSIANNPEIREGMTREQIELAIVRYADQETLYDQPYIDKSRVRVTGPFTFEAVPAPTVRSLEDIELGGIEPESASGKTQPSLADFRHAATPLLDASIARSGATLRHTEWRDELLKTGLRGKGGNQIDFSRVEPLAGTRWLHADAETKGKVPERVVISFGPEHSLLDPRQVESAWQERYIDTGRVVVDPPLFNEDDKRRRIVITLNMTKIVQHIWEAIRFENALTLEPVFDTERPIRSTGDMLPWYSGKACEHTKRSHVNMCVYDSRWEANESLELDRNQNVRAWVKNDHIGFEITYSFKGIIHKFRPDYLVQLTNGKTLILEVKGQDDQQQQTKREFLSEWVRAVNGHGGFGEWTADVSRHPKDVVEILLRHNN